MVLIHWIFNIGIAIEWEATGTILHKCTCLSIVNSAHVIYCSHSFRLDFDQFPECPFGRFLLKSSVQPIGRMSAVCMCASFYLVGNMVSSHFTSHHRFNSNCIGFITIYLCNVILCLWANKYEFILTVDECVIWLIVAQFFILIERPSSE